MKKHIPYLDGWRGLAITCLLIGHFFPVPGINFGTFGVALFFVLSGVLMARVLFIEKTDFGTFYRRRIARVFPSVGVYLAVITSIFFISGNYISARELLSALTFTNNYIITRNWSMPFGHIWSLSVEEHSYVILSLAAWWCRARGGRGIAAMGFILGSIMLAIALYTLVPDVLDNRYYLRTEVASFGIFASGLLLLSITHEKIRLARWWIAPTALVVGALAHWWSVPASAHVVLGWGALALAINAMPAAPRWFLRIFESSWLRRLGVYSFSLYLWQQPFYQLYRHSGMSPLLGLALSLAAGWAAFHLIENPARIYLNKMWGNRPASIIESEAEKLRP